MDENARISGLESFLKIALDHDTCTTEKARIEGDAVVIPFDCFDPDRRPGWIIRYERVRTPAELLEVFGYA